MHFFEFYMHSLLQLLRSFSSLTKCTYKQSNYKPSVKKQDFLAQINFVSFVSSASFLLDQIGFHFQIGFVFCCAAVKKMFIYNIPIHFWWLMIMPPTLRNHFKSPATKTTNWYQQNTYLKLKPNTKKNKKSLTEQNAFI